MDFPRAITVVYCRVNRIRLSVWSCMLHSRRMLFIAVQSRDTGSLWVFSLPLLKWQTGSSVGEKVAWSCFSQVLSSVMWRLQSLNGDLRWTSSLGSVTDTVYVWVIVGGSKYQLMPFSTHVYLFQGLMYIYLHVNVFVSVSLLLSIPTLKRHKYCFFFVVSMNAH